MPFKIKSRANHLLIIQLNTGNTLHLGPGQAALVGDLEIAGNEKVKKLAEANLIGVEELHGHAEKAPPKIGVAAAAPPGQEPPKTRAEKKSAKDSK